MSNIVLERVELDNFKRHKSLTVEFDPGLTVIRGPNYSGKSTVLEAVFFALFGTKAVPGGSSVINNRDSNSKAKVVLDFTVDEEPYSITRSPTTATLLEQDEVIASGHTAVNDWVTETLGTDMKRALLLAFSMQGDTKALLDMGATKLNEFIESVSGADYVDKMAKIAGDIAWKATFTLEANPEPQIDLPESLRSQEKMAEELHAVALAIEKASTNVKKHSDALEVISEKLAKAQKSNSLYATNEKRRAVEQAELSNLTEKITELEAKQKDLADSAAKRPALEEDLAKASDIFVTASDILNKKQGLEHTLADNQKWMKVKGEKFKAMSKNIPFLAKAEKDEKEAKLNLQKVVEIFNAVQGKRTTLLEQIKNSVCTECKRPFDEKHLVDAQKKLVTVEKEFQEAKLAKQKAKEIYEGMEEALDQIRRDQPPPEWEKDIAETEDSIKSCASELNKLDKLKTPNIETALKNKNNLTFELRQAKNDESAIIKLEEKLKKALEEKSELESSLAELPVLKKIDLESLIEEKDKIYGLVTTAKSAKSELRLDQVRKSTELDALKLLIKTAEETVALRLGAEKVQARYTDFKRWLKANKAQFLDDIWEGVLSLAGDFTSQCTQGYVSQVGRSEGGDFFYLEDGYEAPIQGASGGQKSIIGAGLRLAFASLLPASLGFLVLDEPSADLNDNHAAAMAGALRGSGKQVILVTHRTSEEFSSDSIVVLD